jgi:hypothetical protein
MCVLRYDMKGIGYPLVKKPQRFYIPHECASSCARLVARGFTILSQLRNTPLLNVYPVEPAMQKVATLQITAQDRPSISPQQPTGAYWDFQL